MHRRHLLATLFGASLLPTGYLIGREPWWVQEILRADSVTLYALDLEPPSGQGTTPLFHHWRSLGSVPLSHTDDRRQIAAALRASVQAFDGVVVASVLIPRHGLRLQHGGQYTDMVLDFQRAEIYRAGATQPESHLIGRPRTDYLFNLLDTLLRRGGVTPAPPQRY